MPWAFHALNPQPCSLNPEACALCPGPWALNPGPCALDQVRDRWHNIAMVKDRNTGHWMQDEDERLLQVRGRHGGRGRGVHACSCASGEG